MMIYLSNLLKKKNDLMFYTFSYDQKKFSKEIFFEVCTFNFIKIAYKIRKSDYIIVWNSPMHFVWVFSKIFFFSKAKIIWWNHHYPWYYSENTNVLILLKRYLEKFSLKFIDSVISNSLYLQDSLEKTLKVKTKILYPVLDKEFLQHKYKNKHSNSKIIFTYSRWVEWKNLKQVFLTYDYLKKKIPDLELRIWWVWKELDEYIDIYKKDKWVSFLWLLDKNSIIANLEDSRVCLFPSVVDSFWLTIIESMSIWTPVIAFNINWAKELIKNWKDGFLVKSNKAFYEKTFEILVDFELNKKFSKNSLNITKRFSNHEFESNLDKIF